MRGNEPANTVDLWNLMLKQTLAVCFICSLSAVGRQAPGTPPPAVVLDDEGEFILSLAGRQVGTETFKIHSSSGKVEARAEIRLRIDQNGKTVAVESFPNLVLDSQLRPVTYTWNQKGSQSSRLEVDLSRRPVKARYKTVNGKEDDRDFELPGDVAILDDNVIHHYQLIAYRFLALGGGKQTLPVFVPQEALPSVLSVEDLGSVAG